MRTSRILPLLLSALPVGVLGGNILSTNGFSSCSNNPTVKVTNLDVSYNKDTRQLVFNVAGDSTEVQKVKGAITVSAYGKQVYTKSFNPCTDADIKEMCPLPASSFSSSGTETIPSEFASQIPSLAFSVPDLDGNVKLVLTNVDSGKEVACIQSSVGNGNTLQMPAIAYVAAGIAAAALALAGVGALAAGGHPGATTASPTFGEVIGHFQGMAVNGMLSVPYPQVYQSFTTNFAFSTGLVSWGAMQNSIDAFRQKTGGNLTEDNYPYLKHKATLVYAANDNSTSTASRLARRALDSVLVFARNGVQVNGDGQSISTGGGSGSNNSSSSSGQKQDHFVTGIQAYVEELSIPQANTFMTVLLVWAIVVAALIVAILLFKVILEAWSMFGKIPKALESWRKRYWWRLAKAIVNLILMLYGVWTLYCIYQFTDGDSWAAKVLAGVTLGLFTLVLLFFGWRIYKKAHQFKTMDGDAHKLYEDKETWIKYSLFYDNYKKSYWMLFVPAIIYMFAKGAVIAGANRHGLVQCGGQLIVEAIMLALLLWTRPYQRKSGRWINIIIHIVRVASVCCILVFVEELGISQTTKTITGVVLIVVQSVLTVVLAILIAVNALIACIRENPHRKQRKEAEKMNRDLDNLTPLDARNSLLMEPMAQHDTSYKGNSIPPSVAPSGRFRDKKGSYDAVPYQDNDRDYLMNSAASMGGERDRSASRSPPRQPRLPDLDFGNGYGQAR